MPHPHGSARRIAWLIAGATLLLPWVGFAQSTVRVRAEENFRNAPNGDVIAVLDAGMPLAVVRRQGDWLEANLEGWVWMRSLRARDSGSFDVIVSVSEGENLRDAPAGNVVGHLEEGTLLNEVERAPGWIHVRRRGWIWAASTVETATAPGETAPAPPAVPDPPAARNPGGFTRVSQRAAPILTAPDGDTLAVTAPGAEIEVTARRGNWVRVRIDGWMWQPATASTGAQAPEETTPLDPEQLSRDPDGHRGRVVSWTLQFISLERAEAVRTDFFEGEPFLLTRFGGSEGPFVYVAVPPERLEQVEGLVPLERISVTGRIRTGASTLTGTPIVDLLGLERARDAR